MMRHVVSIEGILVVEVLVVTVVTNGMVFLVVVVVVFKTEAPQLKHQNWLVFQTERTQGFTMLVFVVLV